MTINPAISAVDRIADYSPGSPTTAFTVPWPVYVTDGEDPENDLVVMRNGAQLANSDYVFSGTAIPGLSGVYNGGTVTLNLSATTPDRIIIYSDRDPRRVGYFLEGKSLPMTELDKLQNDFAVQMRDMDLSLKRSLKISASLFLDGTNPDTMADTVVAASAAAVSAAAAVSGLVTGVLPLVVKSATTTAPPGSPANGDSYAIPASASGVWAGKGGQVAIRVAGAWTYATPLAGFPVIAQDTFARSHAASGKWVTALSVSLAACGGVLATADAAAAAIGGELVIDTNFTLTGNTTLAATRVVFRNGVITRGTFTLNCKMIDAPDVAIFSKTDSGLVTCTNNIINAAWFGALSDSGTTDNANPFLQWQNALDATLAGTAAARGRIPGGPGYYETSTPIRFYGSMIGDGPNATVIKPKSGFASGYLVDFNYGTVQKIIEGIDFDLTPLGSATTVTAFGSSSSFGGGGSSLGIGKNITIQSPSLGTPAFKAASSGAESGMFTGWSWDNLYIIAPRPISIGNNQDDSRFGVLRLTISAGATGTPVDLGGTNNRYGSIYLSLANVATPDTVLVQLTSNTVIDNIFVENSTNATWLFGCSSSSCQATINNLQTSNIVYTGVSADRALIRLPVPASIVKGYGITLGHFQITSGSLPYDTLFSLFCGTSSNVGPTTLNILGLGYEQWAIVSTAFAVMGSGGTSNSNKIFKFAGRYAAISGFWEAAAPVSGSQPVWGPVTQPATWTNG